MVDVRQWEQVDATMESIWTEFGPLTGVVSGKVPAYPAGTLHQAQDSVGRAQAIGTRAPALASAMQDAFMAGLHTSCVVIGLLCITGAVAAALALPGRLRPAPEVVPA